MSAAPLPTDPDGNVRLVDVLRRATATAGLIQSTLRHVDDIGLHHALADRLQVSVTGVLSLLSGDIAVLAGLDGDELVVSITHRGPALYDRSLNEDDGLMRITGQRQGGQSTVWMSCRLDAEQMVASATPVELPSHRDPAEVRRRIEHVVAAWARGVAGSLAGSGNPERSVR
ncbi:MAG: hypothetical protein AB7L13_23815 [Acidimicrobiia bacterium]